MRRPEVIVLVLLIVDLFLWFLSLLPIPQVAPFGAASGWLAWIAVVLLAVFLFVPGMR